MEQNLLQKSALVLFSGGQDSTTCLFWAKARFQTVYALCIAYGQRHAVEIEQARTIASLAGVELILFQTDLWAGLSGGALLTNDVKIEEPASGTDRAYPNTFVPGRNLIFINIAAIIGAQKDCFDIVGGMCEADFSGYPDCRNDFIRSAESSISLAFDHPFAIHTPLMFLTKAETWALANDLGCLETVIHHSHTCYEGERKQLHEWGYGCGNCPACVLRQKGWQTFIELRQ
jgi:7-cyano-7-deazaguanine synthase